MYPVLTEIGQVRATNDEGVSVTFTPSFFNMARIGLPHEIIDLFGDLFKPLREPVNGLPCVAEVAANTILCACADSDDSMEFIETIPATERIILAAHLMKHGVCGTDRPRRGKGEFSNRFDPSEYIDAAMLHFGLSFDDAGKLSMTRFVKMLAMKYPQADEAEKYPGLDAEAEFDKARAEHLARKAKRNGNESR